MRRAIVTLLAVMALALAAAAPTAADTTGQVSGTYKNLYAYAADCVPHGAMTTCTETNLDVYTVEPPMVTVCVNESTYTYSERTGRGRLISSQGGCSELIDDSVLAITVAHDVLTAALAPTQVTISECGRRTCTEVGTATVSALLSGGPVQPFSSRQTYKDGTCTFRSSQTGYSADVSGVLTLDGTTVAETGSAQQSEVKVQETCR
jgi:hypothetical protein